MADYQTPGIYVEEVKTLPGAVVSVETAIPAFIGYTETARDGKTDLTNVPQKITSILDYEAYFGAAPEFLSVDVEIDADHHPLNVELSHYYLLYYAVKLFYDNGGGECYIVSVGRYGDDIQLGDASDAENDPGLLVGLAALEKEDAPTLLLSPDAVMLNSSDKFFVFQQQMLAQCAGLGDRFAVLDLYAGEEGAEEAFRDGIGTRNLKYGAAYHPWLKSSLAFDVIYDPHVYDIHAGDTYYTFEFTEENEVTTVELVEKEVDADREADIATLEASTYAAAAEPLVYSPVPDAYDPLAYDTLKLAAETIKGQFDQVLTLYEDLIEEETKTDFVGRLDAYTMEVDGDDLPFRELLEFLFILDKSYKSAFGNSGVKALEEMVQDGSDEVTISAVEAIEAYDALILVSEETKDMIFSDYLASKNAQKTIYKDENTGQYTAEAAWNEFCELYDVTVQMVGELTDPENMDFLGDLIAELKGENYDALNDELTEEESAVLNGHATWLAIRDMVANQQLILPPSAGVAGVYATVDNDRGVWKAPANVSLNSVTGTTVKINDRAQESLNVDPTAGKSINVIRAFSGRGVLVWGARTLRGNDDEWRYISVRRFFNYVEESLKKSTRWAVFEPNDAKT
ncbi:MAG: phage tail sheath subtilisin-like domain-containing protein, partial [Bacteroidota bacterium]